MASFNKVLLMGNLTRDPELKFTASEQAVCGFGMAVNRKYKSGDDLKEDVCFCEVAVWGKNGENCAEYLSKGSQVFVEGRLDYQSWDSDSGKRSKLQIVANSVQFLEKKKGDE